MYFTLATSLLAAATVVSAQGVTDPQLTGTWTSKSNKTTTGPNFYDPVKDRFIEPTHPGISYSFTDDGHYESAYYRAIANPTNPNCPQGIMQFQHGSWLKYSNGSVTLAPISVDGRQLLSDPCTSANSAIYTRYNQSELWSRYSIYKDPYSGRTRLDIFKFDGSPQMPLYQVYNPPQMLPTGTLNPTQTSGTASGQKVSATSTSSAKSKREMSQMMKRALGWEDKQNVMEGVKMHEGVIHHGNQWMRADWLWWMGVVMTGTGSVLYFCF